MVKLGSLATNRATLSSITVADLQNFTSMFLDPDFIKCFGVSLSKSEIKSFLKTDIEHWEKYQFGCWSCRDKNNSAFIGRVGLHYVEIDKIVEVGLDYAITPYYWRQGYATEISKLALQFGFENMQFNSIVCFTLPTNIASQNVIKNLGFLYEKNITYKNRPHVFFRVSKELYADQRYRSKS